MSQFADICDSLHTLLFKYPNHSYIVLNVFLGIIDNGYWETESIIRMLESVKGISDKIDAELDKNIKFQKESEWN